MIFILLTSCGPWQHHLWEDMRFVVSSDRLLFLLICFLLQHLHICLILNNNNNNNDNNNNLIDNNNRLFYAKVICSFRICWISIPSEFYLGIFNSFRLYQNEWFVFIHSTISCPSFSTFRWSQSNGFNWWINLAKDAWATLWQ